MRKWMYICLNEWVYILDCACICMYVVSLLDVISPLYMYVWHVFSCLSLFEKVGLFVSFDTDGSGTIDKYEAKKLLHFINVDVRIVWSFMLYKYSNMHVYIYIYIHAYKHTCIHTYIIYLHPCIHILHTYHTYIHTYTHTYIFHIWNTYINTLIYTCIQYIHKFIHIYIHRYTYIHTYIHYILPQFSQATEEKAEELIALIDVEGKGTINFAEFCKFIVLLKQGDARLPQSVCMRRRPMCVCMYVCYMYVCSM